MILFENVVQVLHRSVSTAVEQRPFLLAVGDRASVNRCQFSVDHPRLRMGSIAERLAKQAFASWDEQLGRTQFEDLCQRFHHDSPAFMAELRKKRDHYLAFLKYPDALRRSLSTTNAVEAVNGQLEIIRRNSGGYFQSQDTVKFKLEITLSSLENGRWANVGGRVETCLHQLNAQFQTRFESES